MWAGSGIRMMNKHGMFRAYFVGYVAKFKRSSMQGKPANNCLFFTESTLHQKVIRSFRKTSERIAGGSVTAIDKVSAVGKNHFGCHAGNGVECGSCTYFKIFVYKDEFVFRTFYQVQMNREIAEIAGTQLP